MMFESSHVRVTCDHGVASLWLGFPGEPVNALDSARLRELEAAIDAVAACPFVRVLVVRSSLPAGFCAGLRPEALCSLAHPSDRAAFAWYGQRVACRLADLQAVTLAVIDGPCLGAGFELALACDYRLGVARPTTHLGFPGRYTCFGGAARLRSLLGRRRGAALVSSGVTLSAREAAGLGLVDLACCERRAKIELRSFLDRLCERPLKPPRGHGQTGLAAERAAFASAVLTVHAPPSFPPTLNPVPPVPEVIGLLGGNAEVARLLADAVLRGGSAVVWGDRTPVFAAIDTARRRGFVTPWEAEQARCRVRAADTLDDFARVGWVFVTEPCDPFRLAAVVTKRAVVCVVRPSAAGPVPIPGERLPGIPFPYPGRVVRISFCGRGRVAVFADPARDGDTPAVLADWLGRLGLQPILFPAAARLLPHAA